LAKLLASTLAHFTNWAILCSFSAQFVNWALQIYIEASNLTSNATYKSAQFMKWAENEQRIV
jgi:hypothetical protein